MKKQLHKFKIHRGAIREYFGRRPSLTSLQFTVIRLYMYTYGYIYRYGHTLAMDVAMRMEDTRIYA